MFPPEDFLVGAMINAKMDSKFRILDISPNVKIFKRLVIPKLAPENGWLEYEFPLGMAHFQGLC